MAKERLVLIEKIINALEIAKTAGVPVTFKGNAEIDAILDALVFNGRELSITRIPSTNKIPAHKILIGYTAENKDRAGNLGTVIAQFEARTGQPAKEIYITDSGVICIVQENKEL